ncbi:MAG TPA: aspartate aminotransferase family protein [Pyrinomonadaceae bacterium]|jgi:glutamate/tyrosine decarboxylase-like PLP-dependent enzyme
MSETRAAKNEETLDPDDWEALRVLGHRMVDDMLDYLQTLRERPVWQPIPQEVKEHLNQPLPISAQGAEAAYDDFRQHVLPHPMGNIHPRFWGWVIGTGTPFGALSEMLAATMNPNVGGADQGAVYVEQQVLDWCKEMLGYPSEASGLLVSGGSMANLVGLTVARNVKAEFDVARQGVQAAPRRLVMYGSTEMHNSLQKAAELLGIGNEGLRRIPVNSEFQIDLAALVTAISEDRARGFQPCCVIGNAGTVNTAAFDDLNALADICHDENLWFHVDGAFGALAALSPELRALVKGMERADSLAFDLHKWMYMPYEAGCILVRHAEEHHRTFSVSGAYLAHAKRGLSAGATWFSEYGVQLSRNFRALKIWMLMKEHGLEKYGRVIQQNVEQARYLADLVEARPELELLAPVTLNIVCFRYVDRRLSEARLNELNEELLAQLQESGVAVPSNTILDGKYALRVAITNHRSRREDFDLLIDKLLELARHHVNKMVGQAAELTAELAAE